MDSDREIMMLYTNKTKGFTTDHAELWNGDKQQHFEGEKTTFLVFYFEFKMNKSKYILKHG